MLLHWFIDQLLMEPRSVLSENFGWKCYIKQPQAKMPPRKFALVFAKGIWFPAKMSFWNERILDNFHIPPRS